MLVVFGLGWGSWRGLQRAGVSLGLDCFRAGDVGLSLAVSSLRGNRELSRVTGKEGFTRDV
ncbi:hypothetical protein C2S53_006396 [Perilla frutescens var. hirtella]|uniref:Uncharacterized protein n=1 Tax=Perilla frutescens var. hirtella TaxID=608512 RepID=A0AAD4JF47_PERFH|nr:hypothetical protein C2S53_006396 [Perilla frutescens var. hirtella]